MGDLPNFERGQIVGALLTGTFKTKAAVSKVISAYTNLGKTTSAKRNSERKSTLIERDRRTLRRINSRTSQNYCSTGELQHR
jgi:hypothetical protein